jgi:hypothetical protein
MLAPAIPAAEPLASGSVRRRIWSAPSIRSHSLAVLTASQLHLAPRAGTVKPETIQAIQTGADLEELLGPLTTVIELDSVFRVELNLLSNALTLEYRLPGRSVARVQLNCENHETADELYTKIWRRLGNRVVVHGDRPAMAEVARVPLFIMAGVLLTTSVLALFANWAADSTSGFAWLKPMAAVDWKVICGVGGGILAVLQVVLYRRLTTPPTRLELVESGPPSRE